MIYGIGTDVLSVRQIEKAVNDPEDPFVLRSYTEKERQDILAAPIPLYRYATRFAGKEAVFKSLDLSAADFRPCEIEILSDEKERPYVTLHGILLSRSRDKGIRRIHLSLSYDADLALAFAAAEI